MSESTSQIPYLLPQSTSSGKARHAALDSASLLREAAGSVSYTSRGRLLIIGDQEVKDGTVAVRKQGEGDQGAMQVEAFADTINADV